MPRVHEFRPPVSRPQRVRDERGAAAVEAVIGVPVFMLLILLAAMGGRVALAHQVVQTAAADAARAASIARSASQATSDGIAAGRASLANQNLTSTSTRIRVNTSGFGAPVGSPSQVSATITCQVALADLGLPGAPKSRTITATMTSPLDTYRER